MGFDELKKDQNFHKPRPTGEDQIPIIRHATGNGSQFTQSWKTGNGENWLNQKETVGKAPPSSGAFKGFFGRNKDAKD